MMKKPLHEMTNEELAHEEYMACMVADASEWTLEERESTLASHEAYIEKVHAEIARRGLRAITRSNKTVLVPMESGE